MTGGGSGGHITPILAVAHELKQQHPDSFIVYVGERGGKFQNLTDNHQSIDAVYSIWAGKYRRYYGATRLERLLDFKTMFFNVRDLFLFAAGTVQSWFLLKKIQPDVVFLKGGFVGVPIGLAAAARKIPFVTHDSDAIPGLANRLVSRWAAVHAVALPAQEYHYPTEKTVQVGVLVEPGFRYVSEMDKAMFKEQLRLNSEDFVLLITGGSLGAQRLNEAVKRIAPDLLKDFTNLKIIHQVGRGKAGVYGDFHHERLDVIEFMQPMYVYTGSADIIVSRASGNTVAELGVQAKTVIVVPNPLLANGHQLRNAERLVAQGAVVSIPETATVTDSASLDAEIRRLVQDDVARRALAKQLHALTITNASARLAEQILRLGSAHRSAGEGV